MIHIGFTGTQRGMTAPQREAVALLLTDLAGTEGIAFHHGDCIGADAEAHAIVEAMPGCPIVRHPPESDKKRAFTKSLWAFVPEGYRARNQRIVEHTTVLVAAPRYREDDPRSKRSGTWMTVRMARKAEHPVLLVMPDGEVVR